MPATRDKVTLFADEHIALQRLGATGNAAASQRRRAQRVFKADQRSQGPAGTDAQIGTAFAGGQLPGSRPRQAFV